MIDTGIDLPPIIKDSNFLTFHDVSNHVAAMPRTPVVGIGLPEPKARKHITPELTSAASKAGISLVTLYGDRPLEEQPQVDVILHKIRTPGREKSLVCRTLAGSVQGHGTRTST